VTSHRFFFDAMASRCEIRLTIDDEPAARRLAQLAIDEVRRIEAKYSRYQANSVVSQISAQAGLNWTECDDETLALLDFADQLFTQSTGLFDITSGVLRRAWNFRQPVLPEADVLRSLCALIDWRSVQREGRRIRLPKVGMELDFGGFGKEYAADRAAQVLKAQGVRSGYVNLAGDIQVMGPQITPQGQAQPWLIGIQHPRQSGKLIASIPIAYGALATSGDYERFFELDGRRYCHILHPQSGQPVHHWRSISVLAPSAIVAGSYSTVALLKQEQGRAFLENSGCIYLAIDHAGDMYRKDVIA
jgi:FAD:protein FMN transferase